MSDDRLEGVLSRQERAAARKRARDAQAAADQQEANDLKARTAKAWTVQSDALDKALAELNAAMLPNGVQLYRRQCEPGKGALYRVEVGFSERPASGDPRVVEFSIMADGIVSVRMGNANRMPARQHGFAVQAAAKADWADALLDFVDLNTPA